MRLRRDLEAFALGAGSSAFADTDSYAFASGGSTAFASRGSTATAIAGSFRQRRPREPGDSDRPQQRQRRPPRHGHRDQQQPADALIGETLTVIDGRAR